MINFRYHVVSMTAVFLALAIGLVLGTTALNGPVADALNDQVRGLSNTNQNLRDQVSHLDAELQKQEQFVADLAPSVLGGKLTGRRILLVEAPGADARQVDGVRRMLEIAGGRVTGRVALTDDFTNPAKNELLLDTVTRLVPPSVKDLPANLSGPETASALLAAVLLDHNPPVTPDQRTSVLTGFTTQRFLTVNGDVSGPAEAVVVVAGLPATDRDATKRNDAVVTAVEQFDKAGPIVTAAENDSGDGNAVAAIRDDPALTKTVSTVDDVSAAQGQLVTALALAEQMQGRTGHYGVGGGAAGGLTPKTDKQK